MDENPTFEATPAALKSSSYVEMTKICTCLVKMTPQQTRYLDPMLGYCWASAEDSGPTLTQRSSIFTKPTKYITSRSH